jgi:hypothetical protein
MALASLISEYQLSNDHTSSTYYLATSGNMWYTKGDVAPLHMPFEYVARHPLQDR